MNQDELDAWLIGKKILPEVSNARGYVPYAKGQLEPLQEAFAEFAANQRRWAENRGKPSGGFIMLQHPFSELDLLPIPPQLKPSVAPLERRWDYHPSEPPPEGFVPMIPAKRPRPLPPNRHSTAWAMRRHILRNRDGDDHAGEIVAKRLGYKTPADIERLINDPACREDMWAVIREVNDEAVHEHLRPAKYLLTIAPTMVWKHEHSTAYKNTPRGRKNHRRHLQDYHDGVDVPGNHSHPSRAGDKEIEDKDPRKSPGKRLDANPLAQAAWADADVIYFVLEGKIKADCLFSEILRRGDPASVFSVPSVGQWRADELAAIADRDLRGKVVVLIVDADGSENPMVMTEAILCRSALRDPEYGIRSVGIFHPPIAAYLATKDSPDPLKGVDDHIVAGGSLDDLESAGIELPSLAFTAWAQKHGARIIDGRRVRPDRLKRDFRVMMGLSLLAGVNGESRLPALKKVARFIQQSDDQVGRAIKALVKVGEIELDRPLATARWQRRTNRYTDPQLDWVASSAEGRPIFKIVDPSLHALALPTQRLSEWLKRQGADHATNDAVRKAQGMTTDERIASALERIANAVAPAQTEDEDGAVEELGQAIEAWNENAV